MLGVTESEASFLALDKTRTEAEKQDWAADADAAEGARLQSLGAMDIYETKQQTRMYHKVWPNPCVYILYVT